jgi:myo-inositol 2-dehydrogenase/D-chiro-inositol 1-dehydrogenase
VIGAGIMGADHTNTLRRLVRGAEVTAVADVDLARAETAAAGARAYDDAFALIADPDVDAVVIASHDSVHAEQVVAAVKAGKAVLCEKPLAPTLAEGRQVLRDHRFPPARRCCRWASCAGSTPATCSCARRSTTGRSARGAGAQHQPGVSGAPNATSEFSITGLAIHEFDVVPWLLRLPVVEVSWVAPRRSSQVHEGLQDPQLIHLRTADGVLSTCETFLNARYGYDIRCEVVGETGAISLTEPARVRLDAGQRHGIGYAADWRRGSRRLPDRAAGLGSTPCSPSPTPLATGRGRRGPRAPWPRRSSRRCTTAARTKVELHDFPARSRRRALPDPMDAPPCGGACWAPAGSPRSSPVPCARNTRQQVVAVGSRSVASAKEFATGRIGRAHGSYADLVADPEVDVVYVATPHNFHHGTPCSRWTRASTCWWRSRSR